VDHAAAVAELEGLHDGNGETSGHRGIEGQGRLQEIRKSRSIHQLHGIPMDALLLPERVDFHDAWMIQGRGDLGFMDETLGGVLLLEGIGQDLEGFQPIERAVLDFVH